MVFFYVLQQLDLIIILSIINIYIHNNKCLYIKCIPIEMHYIYYHIDSILYMNIECS